MINSPVEKLQEFSKCSFWIRDDDMLVTSKSIDRVVALSEAANARIRVAFIPPKKPLKIQNLSEHCLAWFHGLEHRVTSPTIKSEFADDSAIPGVEEALARSFTACEQTFNHWFEPVFVPPWNHIGANFFPILERVGFKSISASSHKKLPRNSSGSLNWIDIDIDLMDRSTRRLLSEGEILRRIQRKHQDLDLKGSSYSMGLMTHIVQMSKWDFTTLLDIIKNLQPYITEPRIQFHSE